MTDDPSEHDAPPAPARSKRPHPLFIGGAIAVVTLALGVVLLRGHGAPRRPSPPTSPPASQTDASAPRPTPADIPTPASADASLVESWRDVLLLAADAEGVDPLQHAPGAGPDVLALLAPLVPGSALGAARIDHISAVVQGRIVVTVTLGARQGHLAVMLSSPAGARLIHEGPYVLYIHGEAVPEIMALAPLLAAALRDSNDAGVQVPAGLRPFTVDGPTR